MDQTISYRNTKIHLGALSSTGFNDVLVKEFTGSKKIILTDENVSSLWMQEIIGQFEGLHQAEIIELPAGEEFKTLDICEQVWNALSEYEISRNDLMINIGGGVITDMGGFIASTYKRGIPFINVPTTLLSQVDASVGGKTGIDLGPFKNQIGVFADPVHVYIDIHFLSTLADEEVLSGFAEMLKHGLIADADYWKALKAVNPKNRMELLPFIHRSVTLKKDVVEQDPQEAGLRKILNFGHTIGHAIEGYLLTSGNPVPHGYAVVWGMMAEAQLSVALNLLSREESDEICSLISTFYPKPAIQAVDVDKILPLMLNDKKNRSGSVRFALIDWIGHCKTDVEADAELVREAIIRFL